MVRIVRDSGRKSEQQDVACSRRLWEADLKNLAQLRDGVWGRYHGELGDVKGSHLFLCFSNTESKKNKKYQYQLSLRATSNMVNQCEWAD